MKLDVFRELFAYNDWARDRLLDRVAPIDDAKLDRPFEMGEGSLRKTVAHLYGSEWMWLQRWRGNSPGAADMPKPFPTVAALWEAWRTHAADRNEFVAALSDADLDREVAYVNAKGEHHAALLGPMMLHVANHGTHHRAQALNMLRHLGVAPPALDIIVMRLLR